MTPPLLFYVSDKPTTKTPNTVIPTILVTNVRITEGDDVTLNCTTEVNIHEWSRNEGVPVISKSRTLEDGESRRISATVKDSGKYLCEKDKVRYIFNVSVEGREIFIYLGLWIVMCTYTRCLTKKY